MAASREPRVMCARTFGPLRFCSLIFTNNFEHVRVLLCYCLDLPGGILRPGQLIDVFDEHPRQLKWCEASVVDDNADSVLVHFKVIALIAMTQCVCMLDDSSGFPAVVTRVSCMCEAVDLHAQSRMEHLMCISLQRFVAVFSEI